MSKFSAFIKQIKKWICSHDSNQVITTWKELYSNDFGESWPINVGAFRCNKCNGVYDWILDEKFKPYRLHGLLLQSTGEFCGVETKKNLISEAKLHG